MKTLRNRVTDIYFSVGKVSDEELKDMLSELWNVVSQVTPDNPIVVINVNTPDGNLIERNSDGVLICKVCGTGLGIE